MHEHFVISCKSLFKNVSSSHAGAFFETAFASRGELSRPPGGTIRKTYLTPNCVSYTHMLTPSNKTHPKELINYRKAYVSLSVVNKPDSANSTIK